MRKQPEKKAKYYNDYEPIRNAIGHFDKKDFIQKISVDSYATIKGINPWHFSFIIRILIYEWENIRGQKKYHLENLIKL